MDKSLSNKKLAFIFLLALIFCLPALACADNLIQNSGFDTGVFTPWVRGSAPAGSASETIVDGGYSGKCLMLDPGPNTTGQYVYQIFRGVLIPGREYRFSAKFKATPYHYGYINLHDINWKDKDGNVVKKSFTVMSQGTGGWEDIALSLNIPLQDDSGESTAGHTWYAILYGHLPQGEGSPVYYDDISLIEVEGSGPQPVISEIEEMSGWAKESRLFTDGYPLTAPNPERWSLDNGVLTLKGTRDLQNKYFISLPVKPNTKYKLSMKMKTRDRTAYNYLALRKPNDPSQPLYPAYLSQHGSSDPKAYSILNRTKGIWSGRYSIILREDGRRDMAVSAPVDLGLPYIFNSDIDNWFDQEVSIQTLAQTSSIRVYLTLEGFDGKMIIDHMQLEEVGSTIEDKYLHIPIENGFQGMRIEQVSQDPLEVVTSSGTFHIAQGYVDFIKDGRWLGSFGSHEDILENLTVTQESGIVILENGNIKLSISADSTLTAKLKRDIVLICNGWQAPKHTFEAGVIFTTDYSKGFLFSPLRTKAELLSMPVHYDANTVDYTYLDDDFQAQGIKNWQVVRGFDQTIWQVDYVFKAGDGFIAQIFPPKEFDYKKLYKELMNSFPLSLNTYPNADYSYAIQKFMEKHNIALLWSGSFDYSQNDRNPPQEYYRDSSGIPVAPPPYGPAGSLPVPITSIDIAGPYYVREQAALSRFVSQAHAKGLKVIVYTTPYYYHTANVDSFLDDVANLVNTYDLDGFYFDGLYTHDTLRSLELVRKARNRFPDKFYNQHNSWNNYLTFKTDHFRVPFLDAFADRLLVGESVKKVDEDTWRLDYGGGASNTPSCLLPELRPVDYSLSKEDNARLSWTPQRQINKQLNNRGVFWTPGIERQSYIRDNRFGTAIPYDADNLYWSLVRERAQHYTCGDGVRDVTETILTCPQDCAPETEEATLSKNGDTYQLQSPYSAAQWVVDGLPFYKLHFTFDGDIVTDDSDNRVNPDFDLGTVFAPPRKANVDNRGVFEFDRSTVLKGRTEDAINFRNSFSSFSVFKAAAAGGSEQVLFSLDFGNLYYGLSNNSKPLLSYQRSDLAPAVWGIDSSDHFEGSYSLRMWRGDAITIYAYQVIGPLTSGSTYNLSAKFKTAATNNGYINLYDYDWKDASGKRVGKSFSSMLAGNGNWRNISKAVVIPQFDDSGESTQAHNWYAILYANNPPNDYNVFYYDNVVLTLSGSANNLIVNPGFEQGSNHGPWLIASPMPRGELAGNTTVTGGNWHTMGIVYDKPVLRLYLDGQKEAEARVDFTAYPGFYMLGSKNYYISNFEGFMDDFFIADRALSEEQVMQYHQTQHKTLILPGAGEVSCIINKNGEKFSARPFTDINHPPVLSAVGNQTVNGEANLSFTLSASDPDGDTLTYSASGLPLGAVLNSSTGVFGWTPDSSQAGNHQVTFSVSDGELTDSETITITVIGLRPTNLTAVNLAAGAVKLSWQDNSASEYYFSIERAVSASGPFSVIGTAWANVSEYADYTPATGTTYYYRVKAYLGYGVYSAASNTVSITSSDADAPSNLTAVSLSSGAIQLGWQDNSSAEYYFNIERAPSAAGPFSVIGTAWADSESYSDYNTAIGTTYYYRVKAYAGYGRYSSPSNVVSITPAGVIPPANLTAVNFASRSVRLGWQDNTNGEYYFLVERATAANGPYSVIGMAWANSTNYYDYGLTAGATYYYRVKTYGGYGMYSPPSNTATVTAN